MDNTGLSARERGKLHTQQELANKENTWKINRAERRKRSYQQQLDILDFRLGKGVGAKKERARLKDKIQKKSK